MLVVPLPRDTIETQDGVSFKVLEFTNYRPKGPAVFVEHTPSVPSDAVYFFDIHRINGKTVEFIPGAKVFRSLGPIPRRFQLPQPGDIVTWRAPTGPADVLVKGLKLHKRGELAKGLLIVGEDKSTNEQVLIRLTQLIDLKRDLGNDLFNRDKFLAYYRNYVGVRG